MYKAHVKIAATMLATMALAQGLQAIHPPNGVWNGSQEFSAVCPDNGMEYFWVGPQSVTTDVHTLDAYGTHIAATIGGIVYGGCYLDGYGGAIWPVDASADGGHILRHTSSSNTKDATETSSNTNSYNGGGYSSGSSSGYRSTEVTAVTVDGPVVPYLSSDVNSSTYNDEYSRTDWQNSASTNPDGSSAEWFARSTQTRTIVAKTSPYGADIGISDVPTYYEASAAGGNVISIMFDIEKPSTTMEVHNDFVYVDANGGDPITWGDTNPYNFYATIITVQGSDNASYSSQTATDSYDGTTSSHSEANAASSCNFTSSTGAAVHETRLGGSGFWTHYPTSFNGVALDSQAVYEEPVDLGLQGSTSPGIAVSATARDDSDGGTDGYGGSWNYHNTANVQLEAVTWTNTGM